LACSSLPKTQPIFPVTSWKDRKAIKLASENYPLTDFYDVDQTLTELGTGEAFVTALDRKGRPTPLVRTMLRAPESRMDVLTKAEIKNIVDRSPLVKKYNKDIDRDSAYEMLEKKMEAAAKAEHKAEMAKQKEKAKGSTRRRRAEKSTFEKIMSNTTTRQIGRTIAREFTRGLLGVLGIKKRR